MVPNGYTSAEQRRGTRRVHSIGHNIEPITEQVAVLVKRHRGRLVAKHLLHNLHISTRGDSQRRRSMAQLVRVETGNADSLRSLDQRAPPERTRTYYSAPLASKDKVIRRLALDVASQIIDEKPRNRYLAALVALGRSERHHPFDGSHGLGNQGATAEEIHADRPSRLASPPAEAPCRPGIAP